MPGIVFFQICEYLAKIWTKVWRYVFMADGVRMLRAAPHGAKTWCVAAATATAATITTTTVSVVPRRVACLCAPWLQRCDNNTRRRRRQPTAMTTNDDRYIAKACSGNQFSLRLLVTLDIFLLVSDASQLQYLQWRHSMSGAYVGGGGACARTPLAVLENFVQNVSKNCSFAGHKHKPHAQIMFEAGRGFGGRGLLLLKMYIWNEHVHLPLFSLSVSLSLSVCVHVCLGLAVSLCKHIVYISMCTP